jgi:hypothetical protein
MANVVAFVSYNSATGAVLVEPDPLVVEKGDQTLEWRKKVAVEPWSFESFEADSHKDCFADVDVQPDVITAVDKNRDASCHGLIKYTLTLLDTIKGEKVVNDPFIDNKPG